MAGGDRLSAIQRGCALHAPKLPRFYPFVLLFQLLFQAASIGARRAAYGIPGLWEGGLADYLCEVEVARMPAADWLFNIDSRCFVWERCAGLRHSLYSNSEVIKSVAEWLVRIRRLRNSSVGATVSS